MCFWHQAWLSTIQCLLSLHTNATVMVVTRSWKPYRRSTMPAVASRQSCAKMDAKSEDTGASDTDAEYSTRKMYLMSSETCVIIAFTLKFSKFPVIPPCCKSLCKVIARSSNNLKEARSLNTLKQW